MSLSYEPFPLLCLSNIGVYVCVCVQVCVLVEKGRVFCLHTPEAIMHLTPMSLFVLTLLVDSLMDQAVSLSAALVCRLYRLLPDGSKYTELDFVILMFKM